MNHEMLGGWIDDPKEVELTVAQLDVPAYGISDLSEPEHRDVLLWEEGEVALFGRTLPAFRQKYGTCVSQGYGRGVQDQYYIDLANRRRIAEASADPSSPGQVATEPIYALSRVEIGGGRLGRGDGSVGAWAAKAIQDFGVILRGKYGGWDFSSANEELAKQWGNPGAGLPDELEPIAREHPVRYCQRIDDGRQLRAACYNMYSVPICSGQGFTQERDSRGMCMPSGSWAHCMVSRGIAMLKGGILVIAIQQSWGNNPTGNDVVQLETGREIKLPEGVFMVDFEVVEKRMITARDSFALAGPEGFRSREPYRPMFW